MIISPGYEVTMSAAPSKDSVVHGLAPGEDDLRVIAALCKRTIDDGLGSHIEANNKIYGRPIPVGYTISSDTLKKALHNLYDQFVEMSSIVGHDYFNTYVSIRTFLTTLDRAKIALQRYGQLRRSTKESIISRLKSFQPDTDGFTTRTQYVTHKTTTGRLTIERGPQILTLNAEYRDIVCSRYKAGQVFLIDFVSLEPRVLLHLQNKSSPDDIYEAVSSEVFSGRVDRARTKLATISMLYGAGENKIKTILNVDTLTGQVNKLRTHFGVNDIESRLTEEYNEAGYIRNAFGRPIFPSGPEKHVLFNNFVQSTAAECAMLGFKSLCQNLRDIDARFAPLFIIHDALMIDVDNASSPEVFKIVEAGIETRFGKLPLKITNVLGEDI